MWSGDLWGRAGWGRAKALPKLYCEPLWNKVLSTWKPPVIGEWMLLREGKVKEMEDVVTWSIDLNVPLWKTQRFTWGGPKPANCCQAQPRTWPGEAEVHGFILTAHD